MKRPKVTLHIITSLDGKITGDFGSVPESQEAIKFFESLGFCDDLSESFNFQGWIYGRNTSEQYFTKGKKADLKDVENQLPEGDYLINQGKPKYYIALDRRGKLGWEDNTTSYAGVSAYVIEILTDLASDEYKSFLRRKKIAYIIAGKKEIDLEMALEKLAEYYGLTNLMLGGGGTLNWSFIHAGLCDELSLVITPVIDGRSDTVPLFNADFHHDPKIQTFALIEAQPLKENGLWLRYRSNNVDDSGSSK